ncbi:MAG TPA: hypothetical protein VF278_05255 [Pirellulales bacterium]
MKNTKCDRCKVAYRVGKTKSCKECKKVVLAELRASGYLTTGGYGHSGMTRTADHKENLRETKSGVWD